MHAVKITRIGNSTGVVLPDELLARLKLEQGDTVYVTETPDGLRLTTPSSRIEQQLAQAREIMSRRRDVLSELAK